MDMVILIIWITIIFVAVVMLAVWFINKIIYKHHVMIYDKGNNDLVIIDKAREVVKNGVKYWRLAKERDKELRLMPIPPSQAIDITKKGKKSIIATRSPEGSYQYIRIDSENINVQEPLTTEDRLVYMENFEKANSRKQVSWVQQIPLITSVAALVLIVLGLMIFYGEIAKPVIEARQMQITEAKIQSEMLTLMRDIQLNQQTIGAKLGVTETSAGD